MIIINADDWGRSPTETDAAFACFKAGRISSVSAMVFMVDSERAANIARNTGMDVGLHLNLSQSFTGECLDSSLRADHERIVAFLCWSKYSILIYNPFLREQFQNVYKEQIIEFRRLYGKLPSHIDGHHHKHLCVNMILDQVIPPGAKVRRNFSFRPGEKSLLNRFYRYLIDRRLADRYILTDYFFALSQCYQTDGLSSMTELIEAANVEIMTHPVNECEFDYLMGDSFQRVLACHKTGSYSSL